MKSISITQLESILKQPDHQLIDIRDNYLYQLGTIPGAINIPSNFLQMMPDKYLDKQKHYYLFCNYGVQSSKIVRLLNSLGYDAWNIEGGYHSYHS